MVFVVRFAIPIVYYNFSYGTWSLSNDNQNFTEKITSYYFHIYQKGDVFNPLKYNFDTRQFQIVPSYQAFEMLQRILPDGVYEPIFADKNGIVCMYKCKVFGTLIIAYNSLCTFNAFQRELNSKNFPLLSFKTTSNMSICDNTGRIISTIYPDRNFDLFISKRKQEIISTLDAFQQANSRNSPLGGYGTYNLGIIVYGDPGTGKTLLVKAISRYLNRNVQMIDMRTIKSKTDFEKIFNPPDFNIYCLDEFDSIIDIIQQRTKNGDCPIKGKKESQIKELKLQQMELLKSSNLYIRTKTDETKISLIEQELVNIQTQLKELDNILTLDVVLTILDGVKEHRGRVIIATTNCIEKIDNALLRAGRFDIQVHLEKFEDSEIKEMLKEMFKNSVSREELSSIENYKFPDKKFTPAEIIHIARTNKTLIKTIKSLQ